MTVDEQLSVNVEHRELAVLVRLRGELDLATAPAVADVLGSANSEIVVDFADLTFIDASGLAVLADASLRAEHDGNRLVVINANGFVQRVFEVAGLQDLLSGSDAV